MSYVKKCQFDKRIGMFLQNYASFLINCKKYDEAEQILKESEEHPVDSSYIYNVYSCFATLYYETKEYGKALPYAEKLLESGDSLMQCGGYLHLYRIHKRLGELEKAVRYHDLYRWYDNDITLRRKTTEVAEIPYRMKAFRLEEENRTAHRWQWGWGIGVIAVSVVAVYVVKVLRRRYGKQLEVKEHQLLETVSSLAETRVGMGQLKGLLTRQNKVVERMKSTMGGMKKEHREEICRLRDSITQLETDIKNLREINREKNRSEAELKKELKGMVMQLKIQNDRLVEAEHLHGIDLRIEHFMLQGYAPIAVDMLLQLRQSGEETSRYDIRPSEYLPLLEVLLKQENPALHERLANSGLERKKLTMCYLMALGLDDVEMMSRAACLAPNSVKAYRKECREALCAFNGERTMTGDG